MKLSNNLCREPGFHAYSVRNNAQQKMRAFPLKFPAAELVLP